MKSENDFNVAMIDTTNNIVCQIATDITQTEAYNMVVDLRSKKDGNKYWIGKVEWLGVNYNFSSNKYEGGLKMNNEKKEDEERNARILHLKNLSTLNWTTEQEQKLGEAFGLLDEVMWECEKQEGKKRELNAIAGARFTIERIVTAFSIKKMVEDIKNNE